MREGGPRRAPAVATAQKRALHGLLLAWHRPGTGLAPAWKGGVGAGGGCWLPRRGAVNSSRVLFNSARASAPVLA